jgi:hypothetical protein
MLQACFHWLWCQEVCGEEAYQKTLQIFWRLLICVTLFAIANFLKCSMARVLSYSFYRWACICQDSVKPLLQWHQYTRGQSYADTCTANGRHLPWTL